MAAHELESVTILSFDARLTGATAGSPSSVNHLPAVHCWASQQCHPTCQLGIEGPIGCLTFQLLSYLTCKQRPAVHKKIRYLLLQIRNADDPMRQHEIDCFAGSLRCELDQIEAFDLLAGTPDNGQLDAVDAVLLGGSGDYSVASEGAWLDRTLDGLRRLLDRSQPVFASCWGFQALARAAGGRVVHDRELAEIGNLELQLTSAGVEDPVFGHLSRTFEVLAGHEDHVVDLPQDAVLLASSAAVAHQAYRFEGRPIYCTQFHPELSRDDLLRRLRAYPRYVEEVARMPFEEFVQNCRETPEANSILARFIETVLS